jgi:hypothetical protein
MTRVFCVLRLDGIKRYPSINRRYILKHGFIVRMGKHPETRRNMKQQNVTLTADRWIRLPARGHCPDTGLSRATFYNLIAANRIRSACLRKPGCLKGQRLVYLPSVLALLNDAADAEALRHTEQVQA